MLLQDDITKPYETYRILMGTVTKYDFWAYLKMVKLSTNRGHE